MHCYDIDVQKADFGKLLEWCLVKEGADRMLLIIHLYNEAGTLQLACARQYRNLLKLFGDYILGMKLVSAWPGTQRLRPITPSLACLLHFDPTVARIAAQAGPRVADWIGSRPKFLPEDPCVFRSNHGNPTLMSVTHEQGAWLLTDKSVHLKAVRTSKDDDVGKFFFQDKWFCRRWRGSAETENIEKEIRKWQPGAKRRL
ncbi:MAG TPA: hypothetical protein VF773_06435 [Verrucomicrobiae bacterium]